jgi:lipoic acid synthetase
LYCSIVTGKPQFTYLNEQKEIESIIDVVGGMNLKYLVLTSVTRDDLFDGGSGHYLHVANSLFTRFPELKLELLIPDFKFNEKSYQDIIDAKPYVIGHNLETVKSLYGKIRPRGNYEKALKLLEFFSIRGFLTKTSLIVGLGETWSEIDEFLRDCKLVGVKIVNIGQYLKPGKNNYDVRKIYTESEWERVRKKVKDLNFFHSEIGPFVRSSYMAHRIINLS